MEYVIGALLLGVILFIVFRRGEKLPENVKGISPADLESAMKRRSTWWMYGPRSNMTTGILKAQGTSISIVLNSRQG